MISHEYSRELGVDSYKRYQYSILEPWIWNEIVVGFFSAVVSAFNTTSDWEFNRPIIIINFFAAELCYVLDFILGFI